MELTTLLEQFGFSGKEAKVYLTCLELGQAPVSSIARNVGEQRVTTYAIIKKLVARGIMQSVIKGNSTFYTVIEPNELLQTRETKVQKFKDKIPELLAMSGKFNNRPKVQFYEGIEGLKYAYNQIITTGEDEKENSYFPVFLGTTDIDPAFHSYLMEEFVPRRSESKVPARVIISKNSLNTAYIQSNQKRNEYIVIEKPFFDISGEVILYGKDKVLIAMYTTEELSALLITSKVLHNCFLSMFQLIREEHKK